MIMNRNKIHNLLEYLSLTLILSYFFVHNISLVIIGISQSLYLINEKFINKMMNKFKLLWDKYKNKNDNIKTIDDNTMKSNQQDSKLSLAETIEELGFIPSLNKKDTSKAG